MTSHLGSFFTPSLMTHYLNGFDADPVSGRLTVPRLLIYDDAYPWRSRMEKETFREERAPGLLEEVDEIWGHVRSQFPRLGSSAGSVHLGVWKAFSLGEEHLRFEGPWGRLVEWSREGGEFLLGVGFASPMGLREDLHAVFELSLGLPGGREVRGGYDFGFDPRSLQGLLHFLGIEEPMEYFAWFNRNRLERALHQRLQDGRADLDRFESDQHGVRWRNVAKADDDSSGMLWTEDVYPSLQIYHAFAPTPLLPGFQPLWDGSVRRIRQLISPPVVRIAA